MEPPLLRRPLRHLARLLANHEITSRELVETCLETIRLRDEDVNAVVTVDVDGALEEADRALHSDHEDVPFAGIPMLVKDLELTRGLRTTFGSRALARFVPTEDSWVVARLRRAGFIVVGKTNTPELGSEPVTEPDLHGPCRNPYALDRTPGGSSGGAAAAVAGGYLPGAQGSDGGGSLRIPAACCGVTALKPARGRVSNAPLFGDATLGLSTKGPVGRHVADVADLLDVMAGYAPGDPHWAAPPARPFGEAVDAPPGRRHIGLLAAPPWGSYDRATQETLDRASHLLVGLGHDVNALRLPVKEEVPVDFATIWSASVASAPVPRELLEPFNLHLAKHGDAITAPQLLRAFTNLQLMSRRVVEAMEGYDALLAPVVASLPPRIGEFAGLPHDDRFAAAGNWVSWSPLANVTGLPAITLPIRRHGDTGLPLGVQLIGGPAGEWHLLQLGAQVEEAVGWPQWTPWPDDRGTA